MLVQLKHIGPAHEILVLAYLRMHHTYIYANTDAASGDRCLHFGLRLQVHAATLCMRDVVRTYTLCSSPIIELIAEIERTKSITPLDGGQHELEM